MKKYIIDKKDLESLLQKNNVNRLEVYLFIAYNFESSKLYYSAQASDRSWVNYPGVKIWDNSGGEQWTKTEVLEYICDNIKDTLTNYVNDCMFKFVNF